jgi:hypothetical protein
MKNFVLVAVVTLIALLTSCTVTEQQEVTEWVPSTTTAQTTAQPTTTEETIEVVKVKVETDPTTTEKKKSKKSKKKDPTETTTAVPTQGVVKSGRHIVVTTVNGSLSQKDFYFIYGSATIKLNDKIDKVFNAFGEDYSFTELKKGRREYDYAQFTITTYTDSKDDERVEEIYIDDESWSTAKGAKIGSYGTALRRLYGDPASNSKGVITYTSGSNNLIFSVEDNLVTDISLKFTH